MNSTKKSYDLRELWKRIRIAWRRDRFQVCVTWLIGSYAGYSIGCLIYDAVSHHHAINGWWCVGTGAVLGGTVHAGTCFYFLSIRNVLAKHDPEWQKRVDEVLESDGTCLKVLTVFFIVFGIIAGHCAYGLLPHYMAKPFLEGKFIGTGMALGASVFPVYIFVVVWNTVPSNRE